LESGVWWVYVSGDRLIAQVDGATDGYVLSTGGVAFHHDAVVVDGEIVIAWSRTQGEAPDYLVDGVLVKGDVGQLTLDRTKPRGHVARAPVLPIGPTTPPRVADGRAYDVRPFLSTDVSLQPRSGPTHPQYQTQPNADGVFFIVKFGDIIPTGRSYEMYGWD